MVKVSGEGNARDSHRYICLFAHVKKSHKETEFFRKNSVSLGWAALSFSMNLRCTRYVSRIGGP